jgi:hypothetical protein
MTEAMAEGLAKDGFSREIVFNSQTLGTYITACYVTEV